VAAYAALDDVLARCGRVGGAFSVADARPDSADIEAFLVECGNQVDEAIRAHGFDPESLTAEASSSLLDLVAYGAASRALHALGDRSPEVAAIMVEADAVWALGLASLADGTNPVIAALEAGAAGGGQVVSAGSFWNDEPTYGDYNSRLAEYYRLRNTNLGVGVSKGQKL
jgi:predicted  nucleic acid-binding Zn-ribbon protein